MSSVILVVTFPVLSGDGATILPVVIGDVKVKVKAVANLPLRIVRTSATRAKEIPTRDATNSVTPVEKNITVARNKNSIARKDGWNTKNSTKQKLKDRNKSRIWMPIGLMSWESDIRSQRRRISTSQTMVL